MWRRAAWVVITLINVIPPCRYVEIPLPERLVGLVPPQKLVTGAVRHGLGQIDDTSLNKKRAFQSFCLVDGDGCFSRVIEQQWNEGFGISNASLGPEDSRPTRLQPRASRVFAWLAFSGRGIRGRNIRNEDHFNIRPRDIECRRSSWIDYMQRRIGAAGEVIILQTHESSGDPAPIARLKNISLSADRPVNLDHLVDLPRDREQSSAQQKDRESLAKGAAIVFAFSLIATAATLILYGVNQSREIGGEAIAFVIIAFPFLAIASYFIVALVDPSLSIPFRL